MFTNSSENKPSDKPANAKPVGETQSSRDENNYNAIDKLLEKEILFQADLEEILGKRPFDNPTTYDEFVNGEEHGASKKKKASDKVKDLQHEGVVDHEEVADHHTNLPENRSSKG
jgi:hypothetical protein